MINSVAQPRIICNIEIDIIDIADYVTRIIARQYGLVSKAGDSQTMDDVRQEVYIRLAKITGDHTRAYYIKVGKYRAYQYLRWWRCGHGDYRLEATKLESTDNYLGKPAKEQDQVSDNSEMKIRRIYKTILVIKGDATVYRASRKAALTDSIIIHWAMRGYSNKEIGELINNNAATVSRRRRRIRAMLAQSMQQRQN